MDPHAVAIAFALTILAGLSTGIGSLISLLARKRNTAFLCVSLGFSAGVMIYVSFVEILPQARAALTSDWGAGPGGWGTALAFFGGILFVGLIDKFIPEDINPHEPGRAVCLDGPGGETRADCADTLAQVHALETDIPAEGSAAAPFPPFAEDGPRAGLRRTGLLTALAIAIHNFPEGIATFMAALNDPALGAAIAAAIAIHNIPEGIAVAVPIYYATGSRKKAVLYSALSGLAEPLGALVAFALLLPFLTPALFGVLFAAVAGIMVFISLDELLPAAEEYGAHHLCIYGLVAGMAVMALSLLLLG